MNGIKIRQLGDVSSAPEGAHIKAGDRVEIETTFANGYVNQRIVNHWPSQAPLGAVGPTPGNGEGPPQLIEDIRKVRIVEGQGMTATPPPYDLLALNSALRTLAIHRALIEAAAEDIGPNGACVKPVIDALRAIVEEGWRPPTSTPPKDEPCKCGKRRLRASWSAMTDAGDENTDYMRHSRESCLTRTERDAAKREAT